MGKINYNREGHMVLRFISEAQSEAAFAEQSGMCVACGETMENLEEDAAFVVCPHCHKPMVFGAEQLVTRGRVLPSSKRRA